MFHKSAYMQWYRKSIIHRLFLSSITVWVISILLLLFGSAFVLNHTQTQVIQKDLDRDVLRGSRHLVELVYQYDQEAQLILSNPKQVQSVLAGTELPKNNWSMKPALLEALSLKASLKADCLNPQSSSNQLPRFLCITHRVNEEKGERGYVQVISLQSLIEELTLWDTQARVWSFDWTSFPELFEDTRSELPSADWVGIARLPFSGEFEYLQLRLRLVDSDPYILRALQVCWGFLAILIAFVFVCFTVIFWLQARRVLRPLTNLATEINQVNPRDHQWGHWHGVWPDEIGTVREGLGRAFQKIEALQLQLENQVQVRTNELQNTSELALARLEQIEVLFELSPFGLIEINEQGGIGIFNLRAKLWLDLSHASTSTQTLLIKRLQDYLDLSEIDVQRLFDPSKDCSEITCRTSRGLVEYLSIGRIIDQEQIRLIYLRDISDQQILEKQRRDFLSTTAHELKTPLSSILGFSQLALRMNQQPVMDDHLRVIERQALHMTELLTDLNALFHKSSQATVTYRYQLEYPSSWLRNFLDNYRPEGERKLITQIQDHLRPIMIDGQRIIQVLMNLLSNAVKYSADHSPIELGCKACHLQGVAGILIWVRDWGVGVSVDDQQHLLEPYFRSKNVAKIPGTGLGLSVVRQIIEDHQGQFSFRSELGLGTTVECFIPYDLPHGRTSS